MRALLALAIVGVAVGVALPARADDATMCKLALEDGQGYAKSGKLLVARETLAGCATAECPTATRTECLARIDQVDRALPTVTFVVHDADGKSVDSPALMVDGQPISTPPGRAVPIDPGVHVITFARSGGDANDDKVTVNEGEKSRVVVLTLKPKTIAPPSIAQPPRPVPPPEPPSSRGPGPYVLFIAGGTLVVLAVITQVVAISVNADAEDLNTKRSGIVNGSQIDCSQAQFAGTVINGSTCADLNDSYNRKKSAAAGDQTLAIVGGGLGLLTIGAGVAWFVLATPTPKKAATTIVTPIVGPGVGGLSIGGRF